MSARRIGWAIAVVIAVVSGVTFRAALRTWFFGEPVVAASNAPSDATIDHYTCPMHTSVKQAGPGKCPICGMDLVAVTKAQQAEGIVVLDGARRQLIGVRTAPVAVAPMHAALRASARVAYDESSLTDVSLKVKGWITKLYVTKTGQRVTRGQPLFQVYSPEIFAAQQDLLVATKTTMPALEQAARQRLRLLGVDESTVDAIVKSGTARENVALSAPASGYVIEKNVVEGASLEAGARLFRLASLDKVWVEADVYERDLPNVHVGQHAHVSLDYVADRTFDAKVSYVYPYLDEKARAGRVRLELANEENDLRPGMFARVELAADLGPRLQVPIGAVVYTGPRRIVFVDLGEGRFRPTEVRLGLENEAFYEVLDGLRAGDVVATSGVFLIAAEARIATTAKLWETPPDASTAPPMPPRTPEKTPPTSASPDYTCPMHPEVHSATPGDCPKCGMHLEPRDGKR